MEYTNIQYKFICELIWGVVPIDKNWALESDMFKNTASKILKKYPHLDKSFIEVSKQEVVISKVIKKAQPIS
jgi:dihydroneopterin aldolase